MPELSLILALVLPPAPPMDPATSWVSSIQTPEKNAGTRWVIQPVTTTNEGK